MALLGCSRVFVLCFAVISMRLGCEGAGWIDSTTANTVTMPVDHFSSTKPDTFKLKYLTTNWVRADKTPVFLYIGGEARIEDFVEEAGAVFELARYFKGAAVFVEHRYYGDSIPLDPEKKVKADANNRDYLKVEQVLADVAQFVPYIKSNIIKGPAPVIAVGGFYSGMLAVWMRMKYPHLVQAAWASSAPVQYFEGGGISSGAFANRTTQTYAQSNCSVELVRAAWTSLKNLAKTPAGMTSLNDIFHLADASKILTEADLKYLEDYITNAIETMATYNYPYETTFPLALPAFPVLKACQNLSGPIPIDDTELAKKLYQLVKVYSSDAAICVKPTDPSCNKNDLAKRRSTAEWIYQTCTQIIMTKCAAGAGNDFFPNQCPSCGEPIKIAQEQCVASLTPLFEAAAPYKVEMYKQDSVQQRYGFNFESTSNIIFTNGKLDPWASGGVSTSSALGKTPYHKGVYTFHMDDAAHQHDLRQPNNCDPPAVKYIREQIVKSVIPRILDNTGFADIQIPTQWTGTAWAANSTCGSKAAVDLWGVLDTPITSAAPASGGSGGSTTTTAGTGSGTTATPSTTTTKGSSQNHYSILIMSILLAIISRLNSA